MKKINFYQYSAIPKVYVDGVGEEVFTLGIYNEFGENLVDHIAVNSEIEDIISLDLSRIIEGKYLICVSGSTYVFHKI